MKVMKFGGTSVGTPDRMKEVTKLVIKSGEPVFVVLSAMSGTTNNLVEIADYLYKKNPEGANEVINKLERNYMKHIDNLYSTDEMKEQTREFLISEMNYLRSFTKELFTSFEEKSIVAQGELMSTNMMVNYMKEQGIKAVLLNALDFMRTDKNSEPDPVYIKEKLSGIKYFIYCLYGMFTSYNREEGNCIKNEEKRTCNSKKISHHKIRSPCGL
jgi:aspartate kinase